jgi:uncharacterized delta-60 repeat protein
MRRFAKVLGVLTLAGSLAATAFPALSAGPGSLDLAFGGGFGYVRYADSRGAVDDQGLGVAVQPDGKTLVAGSSGIDTKAVVLRFDAAGKLDPSFADHGVFRWKPDAEIAVAQRVVVQPDGKLLVMGYVGSAAKLLLVRLTPDGGLDTTYGNAGIAIATAAGWQADARRVLIDAEGRPIVVWESIDPSRNRIRVSRFTTTGIVDTDWNLGSVETLIDTSGFGAVTTLPFGAAFDAQGRIVIFASAYTASANKTLVYRLTAAGYPDTAFGDNGRLVHPQLNFAFFDRRWTVLSASDGGFVLVEWTANGVRVERFNFDGTINTGFGAAGIAEFTFAGGNVAPGNATIASDGTIVVTGTRRPASMNQLFVLAVTPTGQPDARFGAGVPQRSFGGLAPGNDASTIPGLVAGDVALVDGNRFAIAGTAVGAANSNDVIAMRLDALAALEPPFGGRGFALWDGGDVIPESTQGAWVQGDGKVLTLNRQGPLEATTWNWRRFRADGTPDTSFGASGKRTLAEAFDGPDVAIFTRADGSVLVARAASAPAFTNRTTIVHYLADGTRDASFGAGGVVTIVDDAQADQHTVKPGLAETDDGSLLVATYGSGGLHLRRFSPDGKVDASFAPASGLVYGALDGRPRVQYTLAVEADGKILVGASKIVVLQAPLPQPSVYSDVVARLMPDGTLDLSFGGGTGVVPIQLEDARDPQVLRILPSVDGKVVVAGNIVHLDIDQFFFLRLNADGSVDTQYGDHTRVDFEAGPFMWGDPIGAHLRDARIDAAGRLIVTGDYLTAAAPDLRTTVFVVRFLANGSIDGAFGGINQHIFFLDRPEPTAAGNVIALDVDAIYVGGESGAFGLLLKLNADGSALTKSQPVFEFHNTLLDHYFITADPAEAAAIDAGAAGPGWERTGLGFRAWIAAQGVPNAQLPGIPGAASPVCRFYGTPGVGPNSHFYTVDAKECDAVRGDAGWRFEGIGFYVIAPAEGRCVFGTVPVYRAYNNKFAQNDSNHRYATSLAVIASMTRQGWIAEGVAFCAPGI